MSSHRQTIALILLFGIAAPAYFGYSAVMQAVLVEEASVFIVPLLWFVLTLTVFSTGAVLWQGIAERSMASGLLILPSMFFAPSLMHGAVILVAALIVFGGLLRISRELASRLRFSVYRSVFVGLAQIIFALSLVISSQYYVHVDTLSWDRLVPSFDLGEGTGAWLLRTIGTVSPSLVSLQDRELSVDGFLREVRPVQSSDESLGLEKSVVEAVRQAETMRSKTELSRLLGREVGGDEKMNEILSEVLRKKVIAFVSGGTPTASGNVPFLPFFLAILLFFYRLSARLHPGTHRAVLLDGHIGCWYPQWAYCFEEDSGRARGHRVRIVEVCPRT